MIHGTVIFRYFDLESSDLISILPRFKREPDRLPTTFFWWPSTFSRVRFPWTLSQDGKLAWEHLQPPQKLTANATWKWMVRIGSMYDRFLLRQFWPIFGCFYCQFQGGYAPVLLKSPLKINGWKMGTLCKNQAAKIWANKPSVGLGGANPRCQG